MGGPAGAVLAPGPALAQKFLTVIRRSLAVRGKNEKGERNAQASRSKMNSKNRSGGSQSAPYFQGIAIA